MRCTMSAPVGVEEELELYVQSGRWLPRDLCWIVRTAGTAGNMYGVEAWPLDRPCRCCCCCQREAEDAAGVDDADDESGRSKDDDNEDGYLCRLAVPVYEATRSGNATDCSRRTSTPKLPRQSSLAGCATASTTARMKSRLGIHARASSTYIHILIQYVTL